MPTRGRPPGSKNRTPTAKPTITSPPDQALLDGVEALVAKNHELAAENDRLRTLLNQIAAALKVRPASTETAPTVRRGPGRPRKEKAPVKRPRRKITDPVLLEKRRAALAKARAVRAERLKTARA